MMRLYCLLFLFFGASYAHADSPITVQNPTRAFGHVIGDVLTQRISWETELDLVPTINLNGERRIDAYLYLLSSTLEIVGTSSKLELRYQIVNAPLQTVTTHLPAISLSAKSGGEQSVEAWPFNVGPLISHENSHNETAMQAPRANRFAASLLVKADQKHLLISAALLGAVVALWVAWMFYLHQTDKRILPFAKAYASMKNNSGKDPNEESQSWIALHQAFNGTAGKVIVEHTIEELYNSAPWLEEYRKLIESFYSASTKRFFHLEETTRKFDVKGLCTTLYLMEKREAKLGLRKTGSEKVEN